VMMGLVLIRRNDQSLPLKAGIGLKIAGTFSLLLILAFGCFTLFKIVKLGMH
jgi:hypothetical protein